MDKAVKKKEERDKHKAARKAEGKPESPSITQEMGDTEEVEGDDDTMDIDKDFAASHDASPTDSSSELKRKREIEEDPSSPKKSRTGSDELQAAPPPPPPPPPMEDTLDADAEYQSPTTEINSGSGTNVSAPQENGHLSPMQLATPSTNGSHQQEPKA
jgi:hypothetical protein